MLEKGVGELSTSEPVTPQTHFMIGWMTKPLTSLTMAREASAVRNGATEYWFERASR